MIKDLLSNRYVHFVALLLLMGAIYMLGDRITEVAARKLSAAG